MKLLLKKSTLFTIIFTLMLSIPFLVNAQETITPPKIDNVLRNNELINIYEGEIIYGLEGDAIRIGGLADPGDEVVVTIADKEYKGVANMYHDWFVLFSITNFDQKSYVIEARASRDGNISSEGARITLIIDKDPGITNTDDNLESGKNNPSTLLIIIIVFLVISILSFTWIMIFRNKSTKTKGKK